MICTHFMVLRKHECPLSLFEDLIKKEGVFHFRTTILSTEKEIPDIMNNFKIFNYDFREIYVDYTWS